MLADVLHLRGAFRLHLLDPDGKLLEERIVNNTVVTSGRRWVLQQLETTDQVTSQTISHMEVGSGTIAPTTANTALGNAVTRKSIASFVTTQLTANPPSWDAVMSLATNEGNTQLSEVGLFNSSAVGTMLARATFASFTKATSNTLSITYTISG